MLPGESRVVINSSDAHAKPELAAAVFDDGSSFGTAEGAADILRKRIDDLRALTAVLAVAEKLSAEDMTGPPAQQQLTEARVASLLTMPDEKASGWLRGEYTALFGNLKRESQREADLSKRLRFQQALIKNMQEREESLKQSKPPL